jgi:hypothetical protein
MPTPTPQQKEYYVQVLPVDTVAVPLTLWTGKIATLPNGDQYWCDGAVWQPYGTSSSTVGSLSSNSPILGNPPNLNTPAKIAAALTNLDMDNDGRVDANKQQAFVHPQTVVSDTWTINHNMNRYPPVLVRNNAGEPVTPNEVQYPTLNTTIITFGVPMSGTAEFI